MRAAVFCVITALLWSSTALRPGFAADSPSGSPKPEGYAILAGSANEVAGRLLNRTAGEFREMKLIIPEPSPMIRAVEFYKTPTAASVGVCFVEVLYVTIEMDQTPGDPRAVRLAPRFMRTDYRYKLIGLPTAERALTRDPDALKAANAQCSQLSTAQDFFRVEDGGDLFRGAEAFRQAVIAARSSSPLPFELTCLDVIWRPSTSGACAGRGREALAAMDPARIGGVSPCREPPAGRFCSTVSYDPPKMANGQEGWSIDVIAAAPGKPQELRLRRFRYPIS